MALNSLGLGFLFTAKDLASGVIHDLKGRLNDLGDEGKAMIKALGGSFAEFGTGLAVAAAGLEGLSKLGEQAAIASHFGSAMKLAGNKVSEAEFPMESMTAIVDELGAKFGVLPIEQAAAMSTAIGAGARDAAKAMALLTSANQIALATGTSTQENVTEVSRVVRAFNLDLKDSVAVGDAMYAASRHVAEGMQGMTHMLTVLSPTALQANMSSNELLATIAQMSAAGIEGRHGITGLESILKSMIDPSQTARVEAARLGIAFDRVSLQSEGLPGVLDAISDSGRMNAHTLEKLFGSTAAATAAMALMRDGGAQLKNMLNEVTHSAGASAAAAAKMISESKRFAAVSETLDTMIGQTLLPMKSEFYKLGTAILESFTKGNPAVVHFLTWLEFGASILAVVLGGGLMIAAAWPIVAGAFTLLAGEAVKAAVAMFMALWPVVLVAAAVGLAIWGLKIAFDQNFGGIGDKVREVWGNIKLVFNALVDLFSGGGFSEDTYKKLEEHSGIRAFAISVYGWVWRIINFFKGIGTGVSESMLILRPIFDRIGVAIGMLVDSFAVLFGANGIGGAHAVFDAFGDSGKILGKVLGAIFGVISLAIELVIGSIQLCVGIIIGVVQGVSALFSGIVDIFYGAAEMVDGIVHGDWAKVWHGFKMLAFGVIDGIIGMVLSLVSAIGGAVDALGGLFGQKMNGQKSILDFKDSIHNTMAKDFGVADTTGLRHIHNETPTGFAPTAQAPDVSPSVAPPSDEAEPQPANAGLLGKLLAPPSAVAVLGGGGGAGSAGEAADHHAAAMLSQLDQIAKNTEGGGAPVNVTVMLDGDVISKAMSKAKRNESTRSFTPEPVQVG